MAQKKRAALDSKAIDARFYDVGTKVSRVGRHSAPSTLYHYTTVEGAHEILTHNKLRAGHMRYSNDHVELTYGMGILSKVLETECKRLPEIQANELREILPIFLTSGNATPDVYAVCLSEKRDLLSQWRGYADAGRGFVIGFDSHELMMDTSFHDSLRGVLYPVYYRVREQKIILAQVVRPFIDEWRRMLAHDEAKAAADKAAIVAHEMATPLLRFIATFKHPGFREEKEWRLVYIDRGGASMRKAEFRASKQGFIPYLNAVPTKSRFLPIREVVVGPGLDWDLQRRTVENWVNRDVNRFARREQASIPRTFREAHVKVLQSEVTFRG